MTDSARATAAEQRRTVRKVATASFFCNFIEWFDYATYSYFAVVIAQVFFPNDDPALALIQTFAVFALSFLLRPIGAIFWGNMGDKKGRKWSLTVSVFMMAGATFCIRTHRQARHVLLDRSRFHRHWFAGGKRVCNGHVHHHAGSRC